MTVFSHWPVFSGNIALNFWLLCEIQNLVDCVCLFYYLCLSLKNSWFMLSHKGFLAILESSWARWKKLSQMNIGPKKVNFSSFIYFFILVLLHHWMPGLTMKLLHTHPRSLASSVDWAMFWRSQWSNKAPKWRYLEGQFAWPCYTVLKLGL